MIDMIADSFPDKTRAVGIVMRHRAEMIASILAVLKTGAMYIPAEPSFPTGRIHYMMEEAHVNFVLTEMQYASKLDGFKQIYSLLLSRAIPHVALKWKKLSCCCS